MSPLIAMKTPATNLRTTALRASCLVLLLLFSLQSDSYCQRGARTLPLGIDQLTQQADDELWIKSVPFRVAQENDPKMRRGIEVLSG